MVITSVAAVSPESNLSFPVKIQTARSHSKIANIKRNVFKGIMVVTNSGTYPQPVEG